MGVARELNTICCPPHLALWLAPTHTAPEQTSPLVFSGPDIDSLAPGLLNFTLNLEGGASSKPHFGSVRVHVQWH